MAESFLRECYEQALLKVFPDSLSALAIKIKNVQETDDSEEIKLALEGIQTFMKTKGGNESGHINLWGKYKFLDFKRDPSSLTIEFGYHGAGAEPGEQKEYGMLFEAEIHKITIPRKALSLSETIKALGVTPFEFICHLHFPHLTRKDYWTQQPNTAEKKERQEQLSRAQSLYEQEYKGDLDFEDPLDQNFSIRFPKLVEYLMDCQAIHSAEKSGITVSEAVKESVTAVEDVLTA